MEACSSIVVKVLCYKPKGRRFETQGGERFLSVYLILLAALGPGVYSASNKNEYQKHKIMFLGSKAVVCKADCLYNVGSLTSQNPISLHILLRAQLYFY
jgi:hypothetical protein